MNKKESREVIHWQAAMWEKRERKAVEEQDGLEIGSFGYEILCQHSHNYRSMKHAVLMCGESLGLITQEECDRCMKDGVASVMGSPWEENAGG